MYLTSQDLQDVGCLPRIKYGVLLYGKVRAEACLLDRCLLIRLSFSTITLKAHSVPLNCFLVGLSYAQAPVHFPIHLQVSSQHTVTREL